MTIALGTRLGAYEIVGALGAGGMGEVYRAQDPRLDRTVAIKILPSQVSSDPDLRQRFDREAKALATLSHPHICAVFDVGDQDGISFLVMEYLEGETLADRLTRAGTALPESEVLKIAIEIGDALSTAHRAGIVHRDLKPGNIMMTRSGTKLLDFGLAKVHPVGPLTRATAAPTLTSPLTGQGMLLGTLQYMSPEQLEGIDVDARSDIFAFGAVVYEMLTGRRAFEGRNQSSVIAAILRVDPPVVSTFQPDTSAALDRLVRICLAKDREARWQTAHDLVLQLQGIADAGSAEAGAAPFPAQKSRREWIAWIAVLVGLVSGAATVGSRYLAVPRPTLGPIRFEVGAPESSPWSPNPEFLAVSPDGRRVAFEVGTNLSGTRLLWLRSLDSASAQPLSGTEDAASPFWSPDGRFIGFFAGGKLKKIDASGGSAQTLSDIPNVVGTSGTWNDDGVILIGAGVIRRVSAGGGAPVAISALDAARGDLTHESPSFLPDGRHFLFVARGRDLDNTMICLGSLDSADTRVLERGVSKALYAPPGYLLFARGGTLVARPFDVGRMAVSGEPLPLADGVRQQRAQAAFSMSETGVLAYQTAATNDIQLVWLGRDGKELGRFGSPLSFHTFWLAPDEKHAVIERLGRQLGGLTQYGDLWHLDGERGAVSRLTFDSAASAGHPVWSPDGRRIAFFSSAQLGVNTTLMVMPVSGVRDVETLVQTPTHLQPSDWSSDGRFVVYEERHQETGYDINVVPIDGGGQPRAVLHSRFAERHGQLSPDGRLMAYTSNETGREEVYVVSFPQISGKWTISTSGGSHARWRRDGKELFFTDAAGRLMSVTIGLAPGFEAGVPQALFDLRAAASDGWNYAVSIDGKRILAMRAVGEALTPITVVVNWTDMLKK